MLSGIEPIRVGLVVALLVAFGYIWLLAGRGRWYTFLSQRFLYGVPWGSLLSIVLVFIFYFVAQSGFSHWHSPVTLPFRSWSYLYPEGMLAAGFAHASPGHLMGNMIATLVLAPLVEFGWSHYPPKRDDPDYEFVPPGNVLQPDSVPLAGNGLLERPWVRALVIFPAVVIVVSLLTSIFAFGWSLGYSGTVFAFGGFAVIYFPLAAVVAMVVFTGTSIVINTIMNPVLVATASPGAPGPPAWWAINVQAHMLGFLLGVLLAILLLSYRDERRRPEMIFFAALIFGLSRGLYQLTDSGGQDVFLQLRGVGIILVLGLTILITATVAASDHPISRAIESESWLPSRRVIASLWLGTVAVLGYLLYESISSGGNFVPLVIALGAVIVFVFMLPGFPSPAGNSSISRKSLLLIALFVVIVVVAIPSATSNSTGMSENPIPDGETIEIGDYEITYAEDARHGRIATNSSGLIVVSEQRQIWSAVVEKEELAHSGEETVPVGGFGWRETVTANRSGWQTTGGETVYAVDLEHADETTRVFRSPPANASVRIEDRNIAIEAVSEEFILNVSTANESSTTIPIPAENATATIDTLQFTTERVDGALSVFVERNGTRVLVAEREQ